MSTRVKLGDRLDCILTKPDGVTGGEMCWEMQSSDVVLYPSQQTHLKLAGDEYPVD